jgi:hypothetical protein
MPMAQHVRAARIAPLQGEAPCLPILAESAEAQTGFLGAELLSLIRLAQWSSLVKPVHLLLRRRNGSEIHAKACVRTASFHSSYSA